MRYFSYHGLVRTGVISLRLVGLAWLIACTGLAVSLVWLVVPLQDAGFLQTISCIAVWAVLLGWGIGMFLINLYPSIRLADDHLDVQVFFAFWVSIRWDEIGQIRPVRWPPFPSDLILVRASKITPAHRLYGWVFARTLQPAFVIRRKMEDSDELLSEIRRRAVDEYRSRG